MGDLLTGSDRDEVQMGQTIPVCCDLLNKGTFETTVTRKGETPKGTGRNSSNWERKADKGLDGIQNRKEQKAGDNKEEKNSWVPGKKN